MKPSSREGHSWSAAGAGTRLSAALNVLDTLTHRGPSVSVRTRAAAAPEGRPAMRRARQQLPLGQACGNLEGLTGLIKQLV